MSGLPSALTRIRRRPTYALAAIVLALLASTMGGLADTATVRLQDTVDAHWRGAYDILVRPRGSRLVLERTGGLVEPNFVGFAGGGGVSMAQLEAIRALEGVSLAAPIAVVGSMNYSFSAPILFTSTLPSKPTLYRVDLEFDTSDGISPVVLGKQTARVLLGPYDLSQPNAPFATDEQYFDYATDGVRIAFPVLPPIESPLVAVDPQAEQELLGSSGAFLRPLIEARDQTGATIGTFNRSLVPATYADANLALSILKGTKNPTILGRPVIPIVVSQQLYASLILRLRVTQLGQPLAAFPSVEDVKGRLAAAQDAAGPGEDQVGESSTDATSYLRPFQPPTLVLTWPGSAPPSNVPFGTGVSNDFQARQLERPNYDAIAPRTGSSAPTFRITQQGAAGLAGAGSGREPEAAYRETVATALGLAQGFVSLNPYDRPFLFAPVGEFDLGAMQLPSDALSYVPLGMYDPPRTVLVADPSGRSLSGSIVRPTLNPAGLIGVPPLAMTDLSGGALLKGDRPIDAIRVRVRGLSNFGPESQRRVEDVASAIAEMGLDVDVVAGSSPRHVEVYVPKYHLGTDGSDLGYVDQTWTTLGVAQRLDVGLGRLNASLLSLAMAAALTLAVAVLILELVIRRREVAILRAVGWSDAQLVRWMLAEAAWPTVLVLVLGVGSWWLLRGGTSALVAIALVAAALPIGSAISWAFALRTTARSVGRGDLSLPRLARRLLVRGPFSLAARNVAGYLGRTLVTSSAAAVSGAALAVGTLNTASAATVAGPTLLGEATVQALAPIQVGLLLVVAAAGLSVVAGMRFLDEQARASDVQVLSAIGWPSRVIRRVGAVEAALIGILAAVLATGLTLVLAGDVEVPPVPALSLASAAAIAVVVAGQLVASLRSSRSVTPIP